MYWLGHAGDERRSASNRSRISPLWMENAENAPRAVERLPCRIRTGVWAVELAEVVTALGRDDARRLRGRIDVQDGGCVLEPGRVGVC